MPHDNIRQYAGLRDQGASTSELRMQILQQHAVILEEKITEEQFHLKMLKNKIEHYSKLIDLKLNT